MNAALFCAGGPASGANGVIHGITSILTSQGWKVFGLQDGLLHLSQGQFIARELTTDLTFPVHEHGGSVIGFDRANPTKDPEQLARLIAILGEHDINYLFAIGGDDTLRQAWRIAKASKGKIKVISIPKTIDNDLPLLAPVPTFGFLTAGSHARRKLLAMIEDARTTGDRQFVEVVMGRTAGWVALDAAPQAVFLPEEFAAGSLTFADLTDLLVGATVKAIAKTVAAEQPFFAERGAVHVVAEGVFELTSDFDEQVRRYCGDRADLWDEHGHVRFSRIPLDTMIGAALTARLDQLGIPKKQKQQLGKSLSMICGKTGFELRCCDPIPRDAEYAVHLGEAAANFALRKKSHVMVYPNADLTTFTAQPYGKIVKAGGKIALRHVPLSASSYQRKLASRLLPCDLKPESPIAKAVAELLGQANLARFKKVAKLAAQHLA